MNLKIIMTLDCQQVQSLLEGTTLSQSPMEPHNRELKYNSVWFEELHNPGTIGTPPTKWVSNISTQEIQDLIQRKSAQDYWGVIWEPHFGNIWMP